MPSTARGLTKSGGVSRCAWCGDSPLYQEYHDTEWGFPRTDGRTLFEMLSLECFQSGLSWLTILRKRHAFRTAFCQFDPAQIAQFGTRDVRRLLNDPGIVRHRGKIEAIIGNARRFSDIVDDYGDFSVFLARFTPDAATRPRRLTWKTLRAMTSTPESAALAGELRRRGWAYVGPTTAYSFMQAAGVVNDHLYGCDIRLVAERTRSSA